MAVGELVGGDLFVVDCLLAGDKDASAGGFVFEQDTAVLVALDLLDVALNSLPVGLDKDRDDLDLKTAQVADFVVDSYSSFVDYD